MSRSYKKTVFIPNSNVSVEGMRKWKHMTTQIRRAREKAMTLISCMADSDLLEKAVDALVDLCDRVEDPKEFTRLLLEG